MLMRAVVCTRYGPPEVLRLEEVERPVPARGEVLVRILATAVTASDCIVRSADVPMRLWLPMRIAIGFGGPRRRILGLVLAGEVESTGEDVRRFAKGDDVWAFTMLRLGAYAEYTCLPEDGLVARRPSSLGHEEAAAIPYGGLLALHVLRNGGVRSGQRVLVYGASGAIGTAAVQIARHLGAEVTGVCSAANLELVASLGAARVVDYTRGDARVPDGLGSCDLVVDAVGRTKGSRLKSMLREEARARNVRYVSVDDGTPRHRPDELVLLKELVETGRLRPVVDRTYPLERIVAAHRYVDQGHKKGNVVIRVEHA